MLKIEKQKNIFHPDPILLFENHFHITSRIMKICIWTWEKVRNDDTIDIVIVVVEQQNVCHNFGNVNVSMEIAQLKLLHCGNHFQFYG